MKTVSHSQTFFFQYRFRLNVSYVEAFHFQVWTWAWPRDNLHFKPFKSGLTDVFSIVVMLQNPSDTIDYYILLHLVSEFFCVPFPVCINER